MMPAGPSGRDRPPRYPRRAMGRIADAVISLLADGPARADELGAALADERRHALARPGGGRAARDARRPAVIQLVDGRLASLARPWRASSSTTVVTRRRGGPGASSSSRTSRRSAMLGIWPPPSPCLRAIAAGEAMAVRVEDAPSGRVSVRRIAAIARRGRDEEAALLAAVAGRLARWRRSGLGRPAGHAPRRGGGVGRGGPRGRAAGRGPPALAVLAEAGYEVHSAGSDPAGPSGQPHRGGGGRPRGRRGRAAGRRAPRRGGAGAGAGARRAAAAHARARPAGAAPPRPDARPRRPRAGTRWRPCAEAFPEDDPEDWYEAAVIAVPGRRRGERAALGRGRAGAVRRRPRPPRSRSCLADIGGDIDAQAAFLRLRAGLADARADADGRRAGRAGHRRGGALLLVEAMVEEVLAAPSRPTTSTAFLSRCSGRPGDAGREAGSRSRPSSRRAWRARRGGAGRPGATAPSGGARPRRGAPGRPPGPPLRPMPPTSSRSSSPSPRSAAGSRRSSS